MRRLTRAFPVVVGTIVLLALVDLGLGAGWGLLTRSPGPAPGDRLNVSGSTRTRPDPRADLPAMADAPWAGEYFRELQLTQLAYAPFTQLRPLPFHGRHINVDGWERRTYATPGSRQDEAPVVWAFGGSAMWGIGQRDHHTIASHLVRMGEAAGMPIVARNFGQRGWVHFQEMLLFEQLLAVEEPPDIAIFYDGVNDLAAEPNSIDGAPATLMPPGSVRLGPEVAEDARAEPSHPARAAWDGYLRTSAVARIARALGDASFRPASAAEAVPVMNAAGRASASRHDGPDVRDAVELYERGRALTSFLAGGHGVEARFFWQPFQRYGSGADASPFLTPPTVDLSDALDGHLDVYLDAAHTNERGAALVAARIWSEIESDVRQWYADRGMPVTPRRTTSRAPEPFRATPRDPEQLIRSARRAVEKAEEDHCRSEAAGGALSSVTTTTPGQAVEMGDLVVRYVGVIVEAGRSAAPEAASVMESFLPQLPATVASSTFDPGRSFVLQLSELVEPRVLDAAIELESAVKVACATAGGG